MFSQNISSDTDSFIMEREKGRNKAQIRSSGKESKMETNYEYWFSILCSRFFTQPLFNLLLFKVEELKYSLFKVEVLQIVFFVRLSIANSIEIILDVPFLTRFFFYLCLQYAFYSII